MPVMGTRDLVALGYRRIVILLVALIIVPTALMLTLGAVLLFLGQESWNLVLGILVVALSGAVVTGVILVWVFVRREANLSRLQSDFVSKVSHELRTPLTSIRLFTETLALRRGDERAAQQCIVALERETTRLQVLIDRLLDWGRMESGHREFHMRVTDVRSVIESALTAFEPTTVRHNAVVDVQLPPASLVIDADRTAMEDALLNLLSNAVKYGGDPPKIAVRVEQAGRDVRIVVDDNGKGIPVGEHKRIFQKFYRVDDRLSRA